MPIIFFTIRTPARFRDICSSAARRICIQNDSLWCVGLSMGGTDQMATLIRVLHLMRTGASLD
jgi:hypothetical protein